MWLAASSGYWPADYLDVLDHALHAKTVRLSIVVTLPPAIAVFSIGYQPLGSCPAQRAERSDFVLCPKRRKRIVGSHVGYGC